jgi:uncharacterized membrane protein YedE/YeeE
VLIIGLRVVVNKPLGALGGYIDLADQVTGRRVVGFSGLLLIGAVLGGLVYSTSSGTFALTTVYDTGIGFLPASGLAQFGVLALAGVLIGIGARTAGGCTSGHGLCGVSLGSRASLVATMTFFGTAVLLSQVMAWALGGGR